LNSSPTCKLKPLTLALVALPRWILLASQAPLMCGKWSNLVTGLVAPRYRRHLQTPMNRNADSRPLDTGRKRDVRSTRWLSIAVSFPTLGASVRVFPQHEVVRIQTVIESLVRFRRARNGERSSCVWRVVVELQVDIDGEFGSLEGPTVVVCVLFCCVWCFEWRFWSVGRATEWIKNRLPSKALVQTRVWVFLLSWLSLRAKFGREGRGAYQTRAP